MEEIFSEISLKQEEELKGYRNGNLVVQCKMDGVQMPVRKLSRDDAEFIGEGPLFSDTQKLWAARMAYRQEMKKNQRVRDLQVVRKENGDFLLRCKIDGRPQLSSKITPAEVKMLQKGLLTQRELVNRYYRNVLVNQQGRVLDENVAKNLTLSLSQKKTK